MVNSACKVLLLLLLAVFLRGESFSADATIAPATGLLSVVQATLERNSSIVIQRQEVEASRGNLQAAAGKFDETVSFSLSTAESKTPLNSVLSASYASDPFYDARQTAYTLDISKIFRSGITFTPSFSLTRTTALSPISSAEQEGVNTMNSASFSFTLTVPLLKGRGEDAAAATEKAAQASYEASVLSLRHVISQNIYQAVQYYWAWVAAVKNLSIYKEAEQRADTVLANTQKLIDHGQRPAASIYQLKANLLSKRSSRIEAEKGVLDASKNLGLLMGINSDMTALLGSPVTEFPFKEDSLKAAALEKEKYFILMALANRDDLRSLNRQQEAAHIAMIAAEKNRLPQLDLTLQAGYKGLTERNAFSDYFNAYGHNMAGPNISASIKYIWPIRNNTASGTYAQQKASYEKALIQASALTRAISAETAITLSSLRKSFQQVIEARDTVALYQKAAESEHKKFTMGMSTVNDIITIENYLTDSLSSETTYLQNFVTLITNLRFQTGKLLSTGTNGYAVNEYDLLSVPEITQ